MQNKTQFEMFLAAVLIQATKTITMTTNTSFFRFCF